MDPHPSRSVTLISNGESTIYGSQMFWNRRWAEMVRIGYNTTVIQEGDRCILVNVSPPLNGSIARDFPDWLTMIEAPQGRFRAPPHGDLFKALESLDLQPEDVTDIVVTPFQLYSTGTLLAFPNARFHLSKRGWAHLHVTKEHPHDDRWRSFDRNTLGELVTGSWERVRLLEDEDEIIPGVRTWWSGGHHRESIVVEIDSRIGVIAVSDTFFCTENITEGRPIGLSENMYECVKAHNRIRDSADHWVSIHDPDVFGIADAGIVRLT
ncbi:hypothetical protein AB4Z38_23590 [Arthrobacter sp. 2RAF6]|uniref:hypothetical protein n=1 Tax=Arthrobacter sp. 2RAF6 TaxID=3233002 RepID=UPI003F8F15AD